MNKGLALSIAFCAAFLLGGTGAVFAGEITGTGESLKPLNGKSACAFSGLEDEPFSPGTVQSFGNHPNNPFPPFGGVAQGNPPNEPGPAAPGVACNPSDPQIPS